MTTGKVKSLISFSSLKIQIQIVVPEVGGFEFNWSLLITGSLITILEADERVTEPTGEERWDIRANITRRITVRKQHKGLWVSGVPYFINFAERKVLKRSNSSILGCCLIVFPSFWVSVARGERSRLCYLYLSLRKAAAIWPSRRAHRKSLDVHIFFWSISLAPWLSNTRGIWYVYFPRSSFRARQPQHP